MELLGRRWIWVGLVKDNYREGDLSWALQSALNSRGGGRKREGITNKGTGKNKKR